MKQVWSQNVPSENSRNVFCVLSESWILCQEDTHKLSKNLVNSLPKKKNMITEVFHLHVFKKKNLNHIYISSGRLLDAEMVKEIHLLPDKICTAL